MPSERRSESNGFRQFLQRVWKRDVRPLLNDRRVEQRRKSARTGGKIAGAAGLVVDSLFHLKGRPFARFMTTMGSTVGAILPDAWDWKWFQKAPADDRRVVEEQVRRRALELEDVEALALFGLPPTATRDALKVAWREASKRYHPDKARDDARRAEFHVRFIAYSAAYERLTTAFDEERLPIL